MASDSSLPDDLAACHALIRQLAEQNAARQPAIEEQQRALEEKQRVLEEVDASYHELQQEHVSENPKVYAVTEPELLRTDSPKSDGFGGLENPPRAGDFQIF